MHAGGLESYGWEMGLPLQVIWPNLFGASV